MNIEYIKGEKKEILSNRILSNINKTTKTNNKSKTNTNNKTNNKSKTDTNNPNNNISCCDDLYIMSHMLYAGLTGNYLKLENYNENEMNIVINMTKKRINKIELDHFHDFMEILVDSNTDVNVMSKIYTTFKVNVKDSNKTLPKTFKQYMDKFYE